MSDKDEEKVVNIFDRPKKEPKEKVPEDEMSFEEIIKKNEENKKRMDRERLKENKRVTRSYRLKKD